MQRTHRLQRTHPGNLSRRQFLTTAPVGAALAAVATLTDTRQGPFMLAALAGPAPYGAVPSQRQLQWHEMDVNAFLHFSMNTFTDKEWGYGDEDPSTFNPTEFNADAIISGLKAAGMRGVILTCKHHDGFCLWPTKTTEHSVRRSKWRDGQGDVVKDLSEAARRQGLKFGVYLSPWDRNSALYGKPEYLRIYRDQLRELLTQYRPIFEVWHDGANGGDGYYGGAREKRLIDKLTYYDWPNTWELVRSLEPGAVIFSDVGPDIRWVGNERGTAGDTCWATFDPVGPNGDAASPGYVRERDLGTGTRNGSRWLPPECDVSIRPGWFYHAKEDARVKTPPQLLSLYYRSVGRGGGFLLNVPPDSRGLLAEKDIAALRAFGDLVRETFRANLAAKAKIKASNVRGNKKEFGTENLLDGNRYSAWITDDAVKTPEAVFSLGREVTFNVVRLRENIQLGQRVEAFELDGWKDGAWSTFAKGTSIGACRLIRTQADVTTTQVRLRITQSPASPALSDFGLFLESKAPG